MASSLVQLWYKALEEGDCVKIMRLLEEDSSLLKRGWKSEDSLEGTNAPWIGRSVFHVAARRGCVQLIVRALQKCQFIEDKVPPEERDECDDLFKEVLCLHDYNIEFSASGARLVRSSREISVTCSDAGQSIDIRREDLSQILSSKDGLYKLDALAMGIICGNENLINLLLYAMKTCDPSIRWIGMIRVPHWIGLNENDQYTQSRLRLLMEDFFKKEPGCGYLEKYIEHPDFNFLHPSEYLMHCTFTSGWIKDEYLQSARGHIRDHLRSHSDRLMYFLFQLRDSQGRTPIHVAADEGTLANFYRFVCSNDYRIREISGQARDARSRLASPRFVNDWDFVTDSFDPFPELKCLIEVDSKCWLNVDTGALSELNGFRRGEYSSTSFCEAIIQNEYYWFQQLWDSLPHQILDWAPSDRIVKTGYSDYVEGYPHVADNEGKTVFLNYLELACLKAENLEMVTCLISYAGEHLHEKERKKVFRNALHAVASSGNYKILKILMDSGYCDPFAEDDDGKNALHYAVGGPIINEFKSHLLDHVSCKRLILKDDRESRKDVLDKAAIADRQGCVNLLLRAGCDVFKVNNKGQSPYPEGHLATNGAFLEWWYTLEGKEFKETQRNLATATNAITITATLVATASYLGPLTPPLGYDDSHNVQYENGWVAAFMFCDNLSFYFAITAIILSLIPSLPVAEQSMMVELLRTRRMVTFATVVLFPSIICVLIAFASSSLAVVSANILTSSIGGKLTITTMCIGVPLSLVAFFLFLKRVMEIFFPHSVITTLNKALHRL